jgi:hypothetical protein
VAHRRVALGGDPEQRRVQHPHGEVRAAPEHAVVLERPRRGERDDQERAHRQEHDHARPAQLGVDGGRQPRVAAPPPPQDREDHQAAGHARERRVVGHERGDLRQREHEDEVEEQLERRHPRDCVVRADDPPGRRCHRGRGHRRNDT